MLSVLGFAAYGLADPVEEVLKKAYPNLKFDAMNPTEIKGIYEVVGGLNVAYFAPETGHLIMGEIFDKTGSVTARRKNEILFAKLKNLPLEKAVKIGNGKNRVIEFTDPDCPYCRRASDFFQKRTDVTRYVFFYPLPSHKDAVNKVKYILCSENRAQSYEEAMKGKLDGETYETCTKEAVDDLLKIHKDAAASMGVTGTPFFIVNNRVVPGAIIPQIEGALIP